ncbi:uncharacterized protein LOC142612246 [Castanea sativa]|uniref:uncharacterized protein LOC142612246 n=1 Tax=Castanea sativa TaxID=21020 RepID=UPI003F650221
MELAPPKTVKEVQSLNGKIVALNRFVSRAMDKCLPFFRTLKRSFEWTEECQKAFEDLKAYLSSPALLSPSKPGEEMFLYLAVSSTAVSAALIRKEDKVQRPVYFISRALREAEEIPTDGKVIADFIIEFTVTDNQGVEKAPIWSIHTDESSNKHVGGAGVVLRTPKGDKIECMIRLNFSTTNNEAEYEALIAGLDLIIAAGANSMIVYSDSQIVTNQVNGSYECKNKRMKRYLEEVKGRTGNVQIKLVQIPREGNQDTDQLAKAASAEPMIILDQVLSFVQLASLIDGTSVQEVSDEHCWMTPIATYLMGSKLPDDKEVARKLKVKAFRFALIKNILYKRGFSRPYLRCLAFEESDYIMREVYEGIFSNHSGSRSLVHKLLRFLVVSIDYFTKWVEAEALATITKKNIRSFVWRNIICRDQEPLLVTRPPAGQRKG